MPKSDIGWGRTPWDDKPREELIELVNMLYAALNSTSAALAISKPLNPTSPYWGKQGTGGRALLEAEQAIEKARDGYGSETIYRSFFRYAVDLLFKNGDNIWSICPSCGQMVRGMDDMPTLIGRNCVDVLPGSVNACSGVMRAITWDDLKPR